MMILMALMGLDLDDMYGTCFQVHNIPFSFEFVFLTSVFRSLRLDLCSRGSCSSLVEARLARKDAQRFRHVSNERK